MFLHLGGDTVVSMKDVIAIFDLENTSISKITREFLHVAEEEGFAHHEAVGLGAEQTGDGEAHLVVIGVHGGQLAFAAGAF